MSEAPREYTADELREQFLRHIWGLVSYWEKESREPTVRGKLEGLVHSILATIDGATIPVPAMALVPLGTEEDKQYFIENGENYYPLNDHDELNCDIGGSLAGIFFSLRPNKN